MALNLRFGGDFRQMNNWEQIISFASQSGIFWRHNIATNQGESDKRRRQIWIGSDQIMQRIKDRSDHVSKKSERCVSFHQSVIIIIFTISWHVLLFLYSMSFSTGERRGGMRSKIVLEMSAEVHVSDFCGPWKWPHGFWGKKTSSGAYGPLRQ